MSDVVIRANGLGKRYLIGHESERERYVALRDVIMRGARNLLRSAGDMMRGRQLIVGDEVEEFWALKDVDFEIRRGEVVGIIGRNGAGKSTLLKILSRITEPTAGRVEIRGRVASLLEVGTGFHPELTGRENIYLNGAILGMTHAEIRRKFDEIVAFAEIERFLDTPVKRYSSGMYVRLAFAVAAHLEPEILIVDEVLAVGDAEFQKKCLGKMKDVAGGGRTVLFVSHNIGVVRRLCSVGLFLMDGRLRSSGDIERCISAYETSGRRRPSAPQLRAGARAAVELSARPAIVSGSGTIDVSALIESKRSFSGALILFLVDASGTPLGAVSVGGMGAVRPLTIEQGVNRITVRVRLPRLASGTYRIHAELADRDKQLVCRVEDAAEFEAQPVPHADESEVLLQAWGFGSLWLEHDLVAVDAGCAPEYNVLAD